MQKEAQKTNKVMQKTTICLLKNKKKLTKFEKNVSDKQTNKGQMHQAKKMTHWLIAIVEEHYHRAILKICNPWDMWSEWLEVTHWPTKRQWQWQDPPEKSLKEQCFFFS